MKQRKLIWQIFPANLVILAVTVVSIVWFGKISMEDFYLNELEKGLVARAYLARPTVSAMLADGSLAQLREYAKKTGREAKTRITVILSDGRVVADSNEDPSTMENHRNRVEIISAMTGAVGTSLRYSRTLGRKMLYVAVPVRVLQEDLPAEVRRDIGAVLRMSVTADAIEVALRGIFSKIVFAAAVFAVLAALASLLVSRNISRPLEEIKKAAERFSRGDFSGRMASTYSGASASLEVAALASAMDTMAAQLNERIETIKAQRNELDTVFSSMVESVIAVDRSERIIDINLAAAALLGIDRQLARGRLIQEVLRNIDLQEQIREVLATGITVEDEIRHVDEGGEKFLQTNIVSLSDEDRNVHGVLVVLNDVTRLRRLESVRRDFVANVSHELRTPITSIRGYVETLLDGAIDDRQDAIRFLTTVLRQAERLNEIIDDLMALSRIEQEADQARIMLETGSLCMVLDVAVETCQHRALGQGVTIELDCPEGIQLKMNETLIEQALVNLLVNAIKYSREGDVIKVVARCEEEKGEQVITIRVIDTGVGIAPNHLPRLFERFYRSDKGRSRNQGGTGLGLAIVKHIALAHNGRVDVDSELNVGSTFTLTLPRGCS